VFRVGRKPVHEDLQYPLAKRAIQNFDWTKGYGRGHPASTTLGYTGAVYQGSGMFSTVIAWHGPSNQTVLTTIGHMILVAQMQIIDMTASGWKAAYDYKRRPYYRRFD